MTDLRALLAVLARVVFASALSTRARESVGVGRREQREELDDACDDTPRSEKPRHWAWANLMRRAFDIDVLAGLPALLGRSPRVSPDC